MTEMPWKGATVLIVDDSANVRRELVRVYESIGMEVVGEAENGLEALRLVKMKDPSLVSLDIIMPEMDGIECYKKLMRSHPEQKCVIISWLGAEASVLENLKNTIPTHIFLAKPAIRDTLEATLQKIYFPETLKSSRTTLEESPADFLDGFGKIIESHK